MPKMSRTELGGSHTESEFCLDFANNIDQATRFKIDLIFRGAIEGIETDAGSARSDPFVYLN